MDSLAFWQSVLLACLLVCSCADDHEDTSEGCAAGTSRLCTCGDAGEGSQVCVDDDGFRWSACSCSEPGDSGADGEIRDHGCPSGNVACTNGRCVAARLRCNGFDDCGDETDELGCAAVDAASGLGDTSGPDADTSPDAKPARDAVVMHSDARIESQDSGGPREGYAWVEIRDISVDERPHGTAGADICGLVAHCEGNHVIGIEAYLELGTGGVCVAHARPACGPNRADPNAALQSGEECDSTSSPSDYVSLGMGGVLWVYFGTDLRDCTLSVAEAQSVGREAYNVFVCAEMNNDDCLNGGHPVGSAVWGGPLTVDLSAEIHARAQCDDLLDNDEDGLVDLLDLGCVNTEDDDEADPESIPACADGFDNDFDGSVDYPDDDDCLSAGAETEAVVHCREGEIVATLDGRGGRVSLDPPPRHEATGTCAGNGPDQVVVVQLDETSRVRFETVPTANDEEFDTVLYIRGRCDDPDSELACNDDSGERLLSRILSSRLEPGTYYVFVDAFDWEVGAGLVDLLVEIVPIGGVCSDDLDNDGDGRVDGADPGCAGPDDRFESDDVVEPAGPPMACANGLDDDDDGQIDYLADPGCFGAGDDDELDPDEMPACADGEDNDGDGRLDFPSDPGCASPGDIAEHDLFGYPTCFNQADDDNDGLTDYYADPGCAGPGDWSEVDSVAVAECSDGADNDGNERIDFPHDPGCGFPGDRDEAPTDAPPRCSNAVDDDDDGLVDWPSDPGCRGAGGDEERECLNTEVVATVDGESARVTFDVPESHRQFPSRGPCGAAGSEVAMLIRLHETSRLAIDTVLGDGGSLPLVGHVRTLCDEPRSEIACTVGSRHFRRFPVVFDRLGSGTYYVFVDVLDGSPRVIEEVDLQIDIVPTGPACGDGVDNDEDGTVDGVDPGCTAADDDDEAGEAAGAVTACDNAIDDDGDGRVDYLADPGCFGVGDDDETDSDPMPACSNDEDDDNDGRVDFPSDPGCANPGDADERDLFREVACSNGIDDDGDGLVDVAEDPGCSGPGDLSEVDPLAVAECSDGVDNDENQRADYPADPGCFGLGDRDEAPNAVLPQCGNGLDDDSDGSTDWPHEPGCDAAGDDDETDPEQPPLCADGEDNDNDGRIDFPEDTGCETAAHDNEYLPPTCHNEIDDDNDGLTDAADPGCAHVFDTDETDEAGGLPQCANGIDDDGDGRADYPDDPDCATAGGPTENQRCAVGLPIIDIGSQGGDVYFLPRGDEQAFEAEEEEDGGFYVLSGTETALAITITEPSIVRVAVTRGSLYARTDCLDPRSEIRRLRGHMGKSTFQFWDLDAGTYYVFIDSSEQTGPQIATVSIRRTAGQCSDGADNDEDGVVDAADPGCRDRFDNDEADREGVIPACSDGLDNDGDGFADWPDDSTCSAAGSPTEDAPRCDSLHPVLLDQEGGELHFVADQRRSRASVRECGVVPPVSWPGREILFEVTVEEPSNIEVAITDRDGQPAPARVFARTVCDDINTQVGCCCGRQGGGRLSLRDVEPGTYYIFVESYLASVQRAELVYGATVTVESTIVECNDAADNDGDGLVDHADPGCIGPRDDDETDTDLTPVCIDGLDNDGDGLIDYPRDDGCRAVGDWSEEIRCAATDDVIVVEQDIALITINTQMRPNVYEPTCSDGGTGPEQVLMIPLVQTSRVVIETLDPTFDTVVSVRRSCDDADSEIACDDWPTGDDPGTFVALDRLEAGNYFVFIDGKAGAAGLTDVAVTVEPIIPTQCGDGLDNDGDERVDLADPGCGYLLDPDEANFGELPACANAVDDDQDGQVDWPDDPECEAAGDTLEGNHCAQPVEVIEVHDNGGAFLVDTRQQVDLYQGSCGSSRTQEIVFALTLEQSAHVRFGTNRSNFSNALFLRTECDVEASEIACDPRGDSESRIERDLQPGTYYLFLDGSRDHWSPTAGRTMVVIETTPL